ncbi:lipopolysaccharide biosynthesis protein [Bacillus piscicola]|uniref:lipopolysaccharide biosynthesis protein n=1 Tax=Bacillus piscicola TaxID=1632684 RepID=UPI001F094105|nr:oligosaccharide flippase family protein [Bacillus piscicola]
MNDTLLKKFLKFSYGSWVGLVIGLITTMLTTRLLAPEAFGKASLFELFLRVGMILTIFGADQAFVRFFYEEKPDKRGALFYNSLRIPIVTTFLMVFLVILFYKPITVFLIGEESLQMAIILSFGVICQLLLRFGQLVIRMQQKGNLYSLLQAFQKVFNLLLIVFFFYLIGAKYEVLIFSNVITLLLLVIIAAFLGKEFWSIKNVKIKDSKHSKRDIIKFGLPFVLSIFISWLFDAFDKIAIRQWSTHDELGLYSAAARLVALVMVLKTTFATYWTPIAYEKFENNPEDKEFFRNIAIIVSFFMFLVAIISIGGKDFIIILLGSDYKEAANIMPFLVFMPVLYTLSLTTMMGINFYKKTKWHIFIAGISCCVNIFANWFLVPNYGAMGASIATAFSYIIFFILRTQISLKYYKVKYPLIRIYLMIIVLSGYGTFSIITDSISQNLLAGLIPFAILILMYLKDIKKLWEMRRSLNRVIK